MVLKSKSLLLMLFLIFQNLVFGNNNLFFTDKYDTNYFSDKQTNETKFYIGSVLFDFIDSLQQEQMLAFIDSFLIKEKLIDASQNLVLNNNTISIDLQQTNAEKCDKISRIWNEQYKLDFLTQLQQAVLSHSSSKEDAEHLIFNHLITNEMTRFFTPTNSVNTVNIAFVIPEKLSENDFKIVFTHYNTKRYSILETNLLQTEVLIDNTLADNEIQYAFPTLNKQVILKNCMHLSILELLYSENIDFETHYYVNQAITTLKIQSEQTNFEHFRLHFSPLSVDDEAFKALKKQAYIKIQKSAAKELFYYSFYDIKLLQNIYEDITLKEFNQYIQQINEREHFVLTINENNTFQIDSSALIAVKKDELTKTIEMNSNALSFKDKSDTLLIAQMIVFMKLNPQFSLAIEGNAKNTEYLYIEKDKKEALLANYASTQYRMSKKKKLGLFRAINIYNMLKAKDIPAQRMSCIGLNTNLSAIRFQFISRDLKTIEKI